MKYTVNIILYISLYFPLFDDPADLVLLTQSSSSWPLLFCLLNSVACSFQQDALCTLRFHRIRGITSLSVLLLSKRNVFLFGDIKKYERKVSSLLISVHE